MSKKTKELSSDNWDREVLGTGLPVLVDFWASWCAPCRALAPVVEQVASEMAGQVSVGALNIDEHADIAARFGIRSIPTLVLFRDGQVVDRHVGGLPKDALVDLVKSHLTVAVPSPEVGGADVER